MRAALSPLALLALSACSAAESDGGANGDQNAAVTDLTTLPPDESASTPTSSLEQGVTEPVVLPDSRIPPFFHGRWGLAAADCASDEPARGLMTISASAIRFSDSIAVPSKGADLSPRQIRGDFDFVGEQGRTWTGPLSLAVSERHLVRVDSEPGSRLVYLRCL